MAENNQNWNNPSNQDWDRNRNRFNQQDESRNRENYGNYGNVNYGNDYRQNQGMQGNYGQGNLGGAYSSDYGSQYGRESRDYGNRGNRQGQGGWQNMGSSNNSQNRREGDWTRNRGAIGSAGMYGGDFGREEPERRDMGYGDDLRTGYSSSYGSQYGFGNYGDRMGSSGMYGSNYDRRNVGGSYGSNMGDQNRNYSGSGNERDRGWWDRTRDEVSSWFGDDDAERRKHMDEQRTGMHRGKGPRGYQRSSERIREDVCDRLSEDDRLDASDIEVQIQGNEVILTGSVHNREDKRRAEDLAESISGVRNVENRLRVERGEDSFRSSTMNTGTTGSTTTSSSRTTGTDTTGSERNRNK